MRYLLIIIVLLPGVLLAQQLQPYRHLKDIHPVGVAGNTVYVLSTETKGWELHTYSADAFQQEKTIALNSRNGKHFRDLEAVFMLDTLPAYITSYADMSKNQRVVELFRVKSDSVLPPVRLGELSMKSIPGDPASGHAIAVEWCASLNGKFIAVSLQAQDDMTTASNRIVTVYNSDCEVISKSKVVIRYPQNVSKAEFDPNDQLRVLNSGVLVHKTILKTHLFDRDKVVSVDLPELSDNYDVCEMSNGAIIICGLSINREGGFVLSVSGRDRSRIISMNFDYPESYRFRLRKLLAQTDGSLLLVSEELIYGKSVQYSRATRTTAGKTATVRASNVRNFVEAGQLRITNRSVLGVENWSKEWEGEGASLENNRSFCTINDGLATLVFANKLSGEQHKAVVTRVLSNGETEQKDLFPEGSAEVLLKECMPLNKGCLVFTKSFFTYYHD